MIEATASEEVEPAGETASDRPVLTPAGTPKSRREAVVDLYEAHRPARSAPSSPKRRGKTFEVMVDSAATGEYVAFTFTRNA